MSHDPEPTIEPVPAAHRLPVPAGAIALVPGTVIDHRFVVTQAIGESGMARLYCCIDRLDGGEVVVKVPRWECESDPASFERFLREERIGVALSDPGLVRIVPIKTMKSRPYLVMESLEGKTLAETLREAPLSEPEALALMARLCVPVAAMHAQGYVHRDLKPSNVMLCSDGSLRVLDFGLSSVPERRRNVLARLTPIFGTPQYMAPEQVGNVAVDEKADVYSLGAILYELLTGEPPFLDDDPWQSGYARLAGDPTAPRQINPRISVEAEEIVLRALRRSRDERYASVLELKKDLETPGRATVTGLAGRLRPPGWHISLHGTPVVAGLLVGSAVIGALIALFFALKTILPHR